MAKLQKSIDKQEALLDATLSLINEGGIQSASMSKVATMANVSPATIYLYFENKQDLINHLYLKSKEAFSKMALKGFDVTLPVKKSFELIWFNIAEYKFKRADEANFLSQCDNAPIVSEEVRKQGLKHLQPLLDLWTRGQQEGIIKDVSHYILYAYTIYPLAFLMNSKGDCTLDEAAKNNAFLSAWDAIKV